MFHSRLLVATALSSAVLSLPVPQAAAQQNQQWFIPNQPRPAAPAPAPRPAPARPAPAPQAEQGAGLIPDGGAPGEGQPQQVQV